VVTAAGQRWAVGEPGDTVAIGDWDCDGLATPAAYRPSSGDVFVFSSWAAPGEPLTAPAVDRVSGGRRLARSDEPGGGTGGGTGGGPDAGGCDTLTVELASGGRHRVEVAR
jgi:hypothetical protein